MLLLFFGSVTYRTSFTQSFSCSAFHPSLRICPERFTQLNVKIYLCSLSLSLSLYFTLCPICLTISCSVQQHSDFSDRRTAGFCNLQPFRGKKNPNFTPKLKREKRKNTIIFSENQSPCSGGFYFSLQNSKSNRTYLMIIWFTHTQTHTNHTHLVPFADEMFVFRKVNAREIYGVVAIGRIRGFTHAHFMQIIYEQLIADERVIKC